MRQPPRPPQGRLPQRLRAILTLLTAALIAVGAPLVMTGSADAGTTLGASAAEKG
ncbi:1,4-beta-xylanase, partial [Micromonospora sp. PPF5-17]|nr:1,4-beta-xylanase [Micromonospora solifontis]NES58658.1 1,4-beta-xylanase [Micromonospora sp. PPF5-6]